MDRSAIKRMRPAALGFVLLTLTLIVYWPAVGYDFVYLDDNAFVSENLIMRDGLSLKSLKWAWTTNHEGHWAPLLWMSFMLDRSVFGSAPWGFHFTNIFLHALNAALVFFLARKWTGGHGSALWIAAFWAWHPLRIESVAWISDRKDVLSGLFFLLCLMFYTWRFQNGKHKRLGFWLAVGAMCLGLLVKKVLMTTPFVLLLLDAWPMYRTEWSWTSLKKTMPGLIKEKWPFWTLGVCTILVSWMTLKAAEIFCRPMPLGLKLLLIPGNYLTYLRQTAWPSVLSAIYPSPVFSMWIFTFALFVLGGLSKLAFILARKRPSILTGWLWFLGMLIPSIGLVWVGTSEGLGDRFSYLPSIGLAIAIAESMAVLASARFLPWLKGLASVTLLLLFVGTRQALPLWKNTGSLLGHTVQVAPGNYVANINYGVWLWQKEGKLGDAEPYLRRALAIQPGDSGLRCDLAWVLALLGKAAEAQTLLSLDMIKTAPSSGALAAWGISCLHLGRLNEAAETLTRALNLEPANPQLRVELLRACYEMGDRQAARHHALLLKKQLGAEFFSYSSLFPWYLSRWQNGAMEYAWKYFDRLAALDSNNVSLLNNLAWVIATDAQSPADLARYSVNYAERAVALSGHTNALAWDTLAAARAHAGDFAGALEAGSSALNLAEKSGDALRAEQINNRMVLYRERKPFRAEKNTIQ